MVTCRALLLAAAVALLPNAGRAALVGADDPVFGHNALLLDTGSGLEYLNLRLTRGISVTQMLGQLGAGGTFAGFRYATLSDVQTLFADAGLTIGAAANYQTQSFAGGESLLSLLGTLYTSSGNLALTGGLTGTAASPGVNDTVTLTDCYTGRSGVCVLGAVPANSSNAQVGTYSATQGYTYLGSFLVKAEAVPEPWSAGMLAAAVSATWAARRRRAASRG